MLSIARTHPQERFGISIFIMLDHVSMIVDTACPSESETQLNQFVREDDKEQEPLSNDLVE